MHPAYYYSVVIQIDNRELYELSDEGISSWNSKERLFPIKSKEHGVDPSIRFIGETIGLVCEDEDGIVSLALKNGVEICVVRSYGTRLRIQRPNQPLQATAAAPRN